MTATKVAAETGLAVQTLANWRVLGKGPRFVRVGRSVRYSRDEVDWFMRGDDDEAHTDAEA